MKALILAAGLGERLGGLTVDRPKAMVPVAGRELLLWVLDFLNHPEISEIGIVTGYLSDKLTKFVKAQAPDAKVYHNPDYRQGSIRTLECAIPFLDDEFLLMNADHIYPPKMLGAILAQRNGIMAVCDFDRHLAGDDMKVKLDGSRNLIRIMKTLSDYDCGYIGMTYCSRNYLEKYKDAVKKTREIYGDNAPVEWVIGHLAANDQKINICDTSGFEWLEVDTPDDLAAAQEKIKKGLWRKK